jgi:hypothetical protein
MAVSATTLNELNDLAKDFYTDVYLEVYNPQTPLKNAFGKLANAQYTGRKWIFGIKTANGGGASNAGSRKTLPGASEGEFDQGEVTTVRTYTRLALDLHTIEVTKKQAGSFKPALSEVMADRLTAHDLEMNRQMFSGGDGRCALVLAAGAASATQTLNSDYGVTNGGNGTRHIYVGDQLAFRRVSDNSLVGRRTVIAVDPDAQQIELESTITTSGGQCYVAKSTADDDNYAAGEAQGLLRSVAASGSDFEGIPTSGRWRSIVSSNSGTLRQLTDTLVMTVIARVRSESRKTPNMAVTRPGVVLRYTELFLPLRRIDGQDEQIIGGYKPITSIQFSGGTIPVMEELDCPDHRMFLLHTESLKMATLVGTEWASADGAQFARITDQDGIEGYMRAYWNLATVQRNANALIADLEDLPEIDRISAA